MPQVWKERTLARPLYWFPIKFFAFPSSSSLKRYSNLRFARSLYSVQRFEFPLVEHHLRTPRRHPYIPIAFRWTHYENSRFGVRRLAPVGPVLLTGMTGDACPTLSSVFFVCSTHIYVCKESDARSLRGGGGELGNLKTLTYGFTTFSQSKLEHTI
jgi:hypothetical protein